MPETYPFLSDEWIAAAREIRAGLPDAPDAGDHRVRMNQIITEVPFGEGTMELHIDSSSGRMDMETGHIDEPDVTVTVDYETAKSIFVEPQTAVQHFMAGKIKVQGDMAKLMEMMQSPEQSPEAAAVQRRLAEITE